MRKLVCVGDSHASFFSGVDKIQPVFPEQSHDRIHGLESVRLGAVLAYSLHREGTQEQGREKLFAKLKSLDCNENAILFCFGEIDCRYHLLKQAETRSIPVISVVEDCIEKYFRVIMEIKAMGFQVVVWNAIPTTHDNFNVEYPNYGTHEQRNDCTRLFNQILQKYCEKAGIVFIDIFDKLVDKSNRTKGYFLFDRVHLGQLAMPYFIEKINEKCNFVKLDVVHQKKSYLNFVREYVKYYYFTLEIRLRNWIRKRKVLLFLYRKFIIKT